MNSLNSVLVSAHQPNLFPWLGFFDKISRADIFVYGDHFENNSRKALWTKRVKIIVSKNEYWLTIPIVRNKEKIFMQIKEMEIQNVHEIAGHHLNTIKNSYKRAPFFSTIFPLIEKFYESKTSFIAERNISFVEDVCKSLEIKTPRIKSSELNCEGKLNDFIVNMVLKVGGNKYLYGGMGASYQDTDKFKNAKIELVPQSFIHPSYPQFNTNIFISGLSIIDPLMNIGFDGVKELLNKFH